MPALMPALMAHSRQESRTGQLRQTCRACSNWARAGCRFGVVIISPSFFVKQWRQADLDALFGKRMESGQNVLLPIWHHIFGDEVQQHSSLLAGLLALNTAVSTVEEIADSLVEAVHTESS